MLDPLDKELERCGHHFARYADDFIILVKSAKAAERVMGSVMRYVEKTLGLTVKRTKSKSGKLAESTVAFAALRPAGSLAAGCLPAVGSRVPNQCPGKGEVERESARPV